VIGTLAVDGWAVTFGTARKGLGGLGLNPNPNPNGASNAGGVGPNRDSRRIAGYRSMTAAVRTTTATVHRAVYRTYCHASVNLCLSQPAWTTTTKRTEFPCMQQ